MNYNLDYHITKSVQLMIRYLTYQSTKNNQNQKKPEYWQMKIMNSYEVFNKSQSKILMNLNVKCKYLNNLDNQDKGKEIIFM